MTEEQKSMVRERPQANTMLLFRGQHICSKDFVQNFKFHFCREYANVATGNAQPLFENSLIPNCNLISQPNALMRNLQLQTLISSYNFRSLIANVNQERFFTQRDQITAKLDQAKNEKKGFSFMKQKDFSALWQDLIDSNFNTSKSDIQ